VTRIQRLDPPYEPAEQELLASMMPPGVPPIGLFRTFVRNRPMTVAMGAWGRYELGRELSLTMREREIVIDRTCARCRCEYEWGVHIVFFAQRVGFDAAHLTSLTHGDASDPCWTEPRERVLIETVDSLHDTSTIDDALWDRLREHLTHAEALDVFMLTGWYHAISFTANAAGVECEPGAPRFVDVA
jgi:alkylhydroperoxidase family enzyme